MKVAIVAFACVLSFVWAQMKELTLPGWPTHDEMKFKTYYGDLEVDDKQSKVHYVFVQQYDYTMKDGPLVLWLQGGPGMSSMFGLAQEIGPFSMNIGEDSWSIPGDKQPNQYSWNRRANLLFFETPVGVGYSTTNRADITDFYTDEKIAQFNYDAMIQFFTNNPEFKTNKFWIYGEGYGAIQAVLLAKKLNAATQKIYNLEGLMLANGILDKDSLGHSVNTTTYYADNNFFGPKLRKIWENTCRVDPDSPRCLYFKEYMDKNLNGVDPYNIYGKCYSNDYEKATPCLYYKGLNGYFNSTDTKKAFGMTDEQALNFDWQGLNLTVHNDYNYYSDPVIEDLADLLNTKNYKLVMINGENDATTPYFLYDYYINEICQYTGMQITKPMATFVNEDEKPGGFLTEYGNEVMRYYQVIGAGKAVGTDQASSLYRIFETNIKYDKKVE